MISHFFFVFAISIDKHKDPLKYMDTADQQNNKIDKYMHKYFLIFCPISVLIISIGSIFYHSLKYDHVDLNNLYRNYRFVYVHFC